MRTPWHYKDIIDLEYFLHRDKDADENNLHHRDRNILMEKRGQLETAGDPSRHELIRLWLNARVANDFSGAEQRSPGKIFQDTLFLAKNLALIKGLLVGLLAGLSFFSYTGTTPVNVFHFLLFFVVSQLALAGLLFTGWFIRMIAPGMRLPSFYSLLFRGMIIRLASFLHKQWLRTLSADRRTSLDQAFGIVKARSAVYGSLFYWPLFDLVQLFATGFNIGLLAATLLKISTSDLAFGWQSTLQMSGEAIHRAVQAAALPWSWLPSQTGGYPSLAEIEGSRIVLKEGIYHLATQNLIAWWPFLVFCLLFYGFFLRLALVVLGRIMEKRALNQLNLDTAACVTVTRRMQTPLVSTQAAPEPAKKEGVFPPPQVQAEPLPSDAAMQPQVVLIPEDIYGICPPAKLAPLLHKRGLAIKSVHTFMAGYDEDQEIKTLLADKCRAPEEGLFILMEGWMPPLVAFLTYLKELREILPEKTLINVGLVGRPVLNGFTPLSQQHLNLWRKKTTAVGDPYLSVFSLIS